MSGEPIPFIWNGEAMEPAKGFRNHCDKSFIIGERYILAPWEERSGASHRHEFAWLREAWMNLPEELAEMYPTETHLRKRALIQAGYFNETVVDVGTKAGALRVAAIMQGDNLFAHVVTRGTLVVRRTALSQARNRMNKKDFQESKQAILEIVATMLKVDPEKLEQEGRQDGR